MESSDEAELILFPIGPSTVIGRAVALRVLFCRSLRELIRRALRQLGQWKRVALLAIRWLFSWINPRRPSVMLAAVLGVGYILRRARSESGKAERTFRRKFWNNMMKTALTYEEWAHAASMLEKEEGRRRKDSDLYDEELVRAKLNELRLRRLESGVEDILFCLRADLVRNLGNMCNPELHKGRLQTPPLIQEYINEVRYHLRAICETDSGEFSFEEKIAFVHETRHAFGRTALLLSGGAALGAFHLGVVRTLIEHRLLPRIVAGASVGSILCSFAATRTWPELQSFFDDPTPPMHFFESMGSIFATAHRLLTRGAVQEIGQLQRKMRQLIGDLTFQEAYDLSGRVLGISICSPRRHEPPRCLNYLTSPHVVIWSAVTASCAFPGLFEAQELMAKDRHGRLVPYHTLSQVGPEEPGIGKRQWRDGSLESDLPMMQLKELFNVNHFIVSQANPHIAPLLRLKELVRAFGGDFAAKLAHLSEMEVKHRCNQVLEMGFRTYGLAKLFSQDWEGDVTIVMPATFAQFAKLIQNPTPSELRKAVMQGRRCTWAKLSAIQANCGIELMLDECVAELNRRRKAQREAERTERAAGHNSGVQPRSSATKRIPSWNCLARESSWGSLSLDDDGGMEAILQPGGPWGGPTIRRLKASRHNCDGSDSDSGTEEFSNLSWTKAGGPLMRTASAAKFLMSLESDADSGATAAAAVAAAGPPPQQLPLSPGDEVKTARLNRANSWDMRSSSSNGGKRSNNKIWEGLKCEEADDDAFSLSLQGGMRKSASATLVSSAVHLLDESVKRNTTTAAAACECSKGLQQQQQPEQESKNRDPDQPESGGSTPRSASSGSGSGSGCLNVGRRTRSLEKSAFGSFIVKYVELPDGQNQEAAAAATAAAVAAAAEAISGSSPRSTSLS